MLLRTQAGLVAAYAALTVARAPGLLLAPRMWAEEATFYLDTALRLPWWKALVTAPAGYYLLVPTTATVLAARLDLRYAALVTTLVALLVQLLPALLIVSNHGTWWLDRPWERGVLLVLVLMTPPNFELWLTTIHSQFYLTACCGLILVMAPGGRAYRTLARVVLAVSALSSVSACVLVPVFALRAGRTGDRERVVQTLILIAGAGLQAVIVAAKLLSGGGLAGRGDPASLDLIALAMLSKSVIGPLAGFRAARRFGEAIFWHVDLGSMAWWLLVGATLLLVGTLVLDAIRSRTWDALHLMAASGLTVEAAFLFGRGSKWTFLTGEGAGRYFYAANLFLYLALWLCARREASRSLRWLKGAVLAVFLVQAVVYFVEAPSRWSVFAGPRWSDQVARFKAGQQDYVEAWPQGERFRPPAPEQ